MIVPIFQTATFGHHGPEPRPADTYNCVYTRPADNPNHKVCRAAQCFASMSCAFLQSLTLNFCLSSLQRSLQPWKARKMQLFLAAEWRPSAPQCLHCSNREITS